MVPRGTSFLGLDGELAEAMAIGIKRVHREPITADNSWTWGFQFGALKLRNARPYRFEEAPAFGGLQARYGTSARAINIEPQRPYLPRIISQRVGRPIVAVPCAVRALRLHEIDVEDAIAEGMGIFRLKCGAQPRDINYGWPMTFQALLGRLPKRTRGSWARTELGEAMTDEAARELYALSWAIRYGLQSWLDNPWVWRWEFRIDPEESLQLEQWEVAS